MTRQLQRLTDALFPGARVWVHAMSGQSALLAAELHAEPERARDVRFMAVQFPGIDSLDYPSLHPSAQQTAYFMSPTLRPAMAQGRVELHGMDYSAMARHLRASAPVDVAIAQVSPPDRYGRCSPGLNADFMPLVWDRARKRVVHINPNMPRTRGSFTVDLSQVDGVVPAQTELLHYTASPSTDTDRLIAGHAAHWVRDGDTLQLGMGSVPLALATALTHHRHLKLHTGMVTQALRQLDEAGALDQQARITTGLALGDASFYDYVARNERLWFTDVEHTHSLAALFALPRFVAINAALEVDLFGQVNSERANGRLQAGAGGLPLFAQAALASPDGRLLICLRATTASGKVSRIVPCLGDGALCTLPRYLADTIVTEYGSADLRGLALDARAQALIRIAAPEHQGALSAAWGRMRAGL